MDIEKKPVAYRSFNKIGGKETKEKAWSVIYLILSLGCLAAYFLFRYDVIPIPAKYNDEVEKLALGCFVGTLILMISKGAEIAVLRRARRVYSRYNLTRMIRLLTWAMICFVIISFLFKNWYSAAVSLGLFSLILGFALQTPISSFIGWLYIIIRQPYHVGDRIQIDDFKGDVVEVSYLDTTLWEFAGDYLSNDVPSGRLIRFPNTLVLQSAVYNYSWEKFPFIWNEIPFHVAYESDLDWIERTIKEITLKELGAEAQKNIDRFKELVKQTPVDELNIREYPFVSFRINPNTWVEACVTYLVEPKKAAVLRSKLIKKILVALNNAPDKSMFPKSNAR